MRRRGFCGGHGRGGLTGELGTVETELSVKAVDG